jgi:hypothetical protein
MRISGSEFRSESVDNSDNFGTSEDFLLSRHRASFRQHSETHRGC